MSTVTLLDSTVQPTVAVSSHINKNLLSVAVANTTDLTNFLKINLVNPSLVPVDDGTAVLLKSNGSDLDSFCDIEGGAGCGKITSKLRPDPYPAAGSDDELLKRTVSGQIYVPSDVFNATSKHERAFRIVVMYNNDSSYLEVRSNAATVADSWVDLSVTVEVPPTATEAFIRLYNGTEVTTDGVRFRHLKVEQGSTNTGWIAPTSNTQDSQNILSKWEDESNITAEDATPAQTILNGIANESQYSRLLTSSVLRTYKNLASLNQSNGGEDGTINGFEAEGATYTNILDPEVANGSESGTVPSCVGKTQGTETITSSTDWYATGSRSIKVHCPGTNAYEGCFISGLTAGKTYTLHLTIHNIPSDNSLVFNVATDNIDIAGTGEDVVFVKTFTAPSNGSFTITTPVTPYAIDFSIDKIQAVEGSTNYPHIAGGSTGSTAEILNEKDAQKTSQQHFVYVTMYAYNFTPPISFFTDLKSKGATDIIDIGSYSNFADMTQTDINHMISICELCKSAGLNFYACFPPFKRADSTYADPSDSTFISNCTSKIATIFTQCPDLAGITFDDYYYQIADSKTDAQKTAVLVSFAEAMTSAVHSVKSSATCSASIVYPEVYCATITDLAPAFDFIFTQNYRFGEEGLTWMAEQVQEVLIKAGNNLVIPTLSIFKRSDNLQFQPAQTIMRDIYQIGSVTGGYCLFYWKDGKPDGITFPTTTPGSYQGTHSIQVQTGGYQAGEGIKISIIGMSTDKTFSGQIRVKAPAGVNLSFKLGSGATKSITGDGTYQLISDSETPTTGYLHVVTTSALTTAFSIDAVSVNEGNTLYDWVLGQTIASIPNQYLPDFTPENTNIYGVTVKVKARALTNHVSQNVNTCGAILNNLTGFDKVNGDETLTTSGGVLTISTPGTAAPEGVSWHATGLTVGKQYTVQINANIPDGAQVALVNYTTGTSANWTIVNSSGMFALREFTFIANAADNVIHLQATTAQALTILIKSITVVRDTTGMQLKAFATNPTVTLDTCFVNTASGANNIKRTSTTALQEEYAWITLGSNEDQWGWKLLRELIQDGNFGAAIQFKTSSSEDAEALVQVDDVQLDVTYYYPESDLQATIKTDHQTLFVGEVALIEYLIVNNGPCPATNVVATINLPASFTLLYSTLIKGTYTNGTWTIPTLANGETAKLHILAEATAEGTTTASVTSSVDDPTTINNSASYTFNIQTITATTDSNIGFWYDGGYSQQYGVPYCSEIVRNMRGETTDAVMDISRRDGTIPVGQDDSARKIDVTFPILGTDYEDLRTKVKNIAGWLKTNRIGNNHPETAELIFDDDPTHKYNVYPQGEIPAPQEFSKVAATVSFYLPVPYAEKRWLVLSGPAGNNEGTVATYPTITLIANAVTELKVVNQQTNQEIAINHTFGGGEKVVIDCDKRTVYADDVDLRSQVEFTSSFFKIWPGVFEITAVGGSISAVAYKELSY